MNVTAYSIAQRFVGVREVRGKVANPLILAMLKLDDEWPENDEVPWCSAFLNFVAWLLRLPRSKSLAARSWLLVGTPVPPGEARPGFDVVILSRTAAGPEVIDAPGHAGFFAGYAGNQIVLLGGNQGDAVSLGYFPAGRILGIRRIYSEE